LQSFDHRLKTGTVKIAAGPVIINKLPSNNDTIPAAIVFKNLPLVRNTARFAQTLIFIREPQVNTRNVNGMRAFDRITVEPPS
jgi:hypothetical protein